MNGSKILIIGQAPAAKTQNIPYDTTLLYQILSWVDISKEEAQTMFEFEAMTDVFPGKGKNGHKAPAASEMFRYYQAVLKDKMAINKKIVVLGNVAHIALIRFNAITPQNEFIFLLHPSRRNYKKIMDSKESITRDLYDFIKK